MITAPFGSPDERMGRKTKRHISLKMDSIELLSRDLTEAHGVPGYETPIRAVVRKCLEWN
jgi:hypothetical protein